MREDGDHNYELAVGALDDPNLIRRLERQVGIESKVQWFDSIAILPSQPTDQEWTTDDMADKLRSLQHPDHEFSVGDEDPEDGNTTAGK
jgi:hypothetical protein